MYSSAGLGKEFGVYSKCPVVWIKPGKLTLWHLSHPHCSASRPTISSSSKLKVSLRPSECQLCYLQTSTLLCPLSPHDYSVQPTVRDGHLCMSRCLGWGDWKARSPLVRVAFKACVLSAQLLRLLLNFMAHKPHRNRESEHPCYYKSVKTGAIFHGLKSTHSCPPVSPECLLAGSSPLWHLRETWVILVLRLSGNDIPLRWKSRSEI